MTSITKTAFCVTCLLLVMVMVTVRLSDAQQGQSHQPWDWEALGWKNTDEEYVAEAGGQQIHQHHARSAGAQHPFESRPPSVIDMFPPFPRMDFMPMPMPVPVPDFLIPVAENIGLTGRDNLSSRKQTKVKVKQQRKPDGSVRRCYNCDNGKGYEYFYTYPIGSEPGSPVKGFSYVSGTGGWDGPWVVEERRVDKKGGGNQVIKKAGNSYSHSSSFGSSWSF